MECSKGKVSILTRVKDFLNDRTKQHMHSPNIMKKIVLVGNPNVGKSVIFNSLTGAYVTVSNYPGTTVEISRGWYVDNGVKFEIIDTPGMYSIMPITEEERVTRRLLLSEKSDVVIHVIDAKNIERMLVLTLQLLEAGLEVFLVLNIMDESESLGININCKELESVLKVPVIAASALLNMGLEDIKSTLSTICTETVFRYCKV